MRTERIEIENFRQYRHAVFPFIKGSSDINIVIGSNGTGKTNLLNAINWCLYGDEPHSSKSKEQLPIVNVEAIKSANDSKFSLNTRVSLFLITDDKIKFIIERKMKTFLEKKDEEFVPVPRISVLTVTKKVTGEKNDLVLKNDQAKSLVERILPIRIREFFFFDGEQLNKYFSASTGNKIYNSIYDLAQVDLIVKMISNLRNVKRDLERKATKFNAQAEKYQQDKEDAESNLNELTERINEAKEQRDLAKEKINEYTLKLNSLPDVFLLNEEKEKIRKKVKEIENLRLDKKERKNEFLLYSNTTLNCFSAIFYSLNLIKDKKEKGEIPATDDVSLIESILKKNKCICGTNISKNEAAIIQLKKMRDSINISKTSSSKLTSINPILDGIISEISSFNKKIEPINNDLNYYDEELSNFEKRLNDIDKEIVGHNEERISAWHHELKQFENTFESKTSQLALWNNQKQELEQKITECESIIEEELEKEEKSKKLMVQIDFCSSSIKILERSKNKILDDLRAEMEAETKRIFFKLHWKRDTFEDVRIDEDFSIHLIHKEGYDCLGSSSAGEGQILALSFIIALHDISRFEAPIFIDTPVGRISDKLRKNVAEIFAELSKSKQLLVLFTPSEYSSDISEVLDPIRANKFELDPSHSETEIKVKIL